MAILTTGASAFADHPTLSAASKARPAHPSHDARLVGVGSGTVPWRKRAVQLSFDALYLGGTLQFGLLRLKCSQLFPSFNDLFVDRPQFNFRFRACQVF
jgi:hypothetical protein